MYDDDKPVKEIAWEEVAKQQASALMWHRRHPRQQPLDTPTPCVITASVQGSVSLSRQSKDSGADAANSYFTASPRLPSSPCQGAQDVPLPTPCDEPDAAAAISPPVLSNPPPPSPPCQAAQSVQPPDRHEELDAVAVISAPTPLDTYSVPKFNEEPIAVADLSLNPPSFTRPSSSPHHLHASRPTSCAVSQSHPSVTGWAMAEAQSGRLPHDAPPAAADTAHLPFARAHLPALSASNSRASSAARDYRSDNKLPTTSKASAAASAAHGAVAATGRARTRANCRAGAVTAAGPPQTKGRAGAVAANGPPQSKANCRPGAVAATGPAKSKANCRAGSTASIGPVQTKMKKTSRAVAASGSVSTKADTRAASAATVTRRKPLPAEGGSALTTIQEGELDQSWAGVQCMLLQLAKGRNAFPSLQLMLALAQGLLSSFAIDACFAARCALPTPLHCQLVPFA